MSLVYANGSQVIGNLNQAKIFVRDNRFITGKFSYDNSGSGSDFVAPTGQILARVASSGLLVLLNSSGTDGTETPVGILAGDVTVPAGVNASSAGAALPCTICIAGDVNTNFLVFTPGSGDTLATVIDNRQLGDKIKADTAGVYLVTTVDPTITDNQ
jgi:hypothetical protein